MQELLSREADSFFESMNAPSPVSIRLNFRKLKEWNGIPIPWCSSGYYLDKRPQFTLDPLFHAGAYYVQEASSMFIEEVIRQTGLDKNPIRMLDLCAAPGGKSTHLLALLHHQSLLVANETIRSRVGMLSENLSKWGYCNYAVVSNDPREFSRTPDFFDCIMLDAPCSGEGMFRKNPDSTQQWSTRQVETCAMRQERILKDAWVALKPGGILIYSTCTFNEKENEDTVNLICNTFNTSCMELKMDSHTGIICRKKGKAVCYRFYPHKLKGEGLCISVICKPGSANRTEMKIAEDKKKHVWAIPADKVFDFICNTNSQLGFYKNGNDYFFINKIHERDLQYLHARLNVISAGTTIGQFKKSDFVPNPALAFSNYLNKHFFPVWETSFAEALKILKGETGFENNFSPGLLLATFQGIPFSFLRKTGNRLNNLYPKNMYVRMETTVNP